MTKDETYFFHQTPEELAIQLINMLEIEAGDILLEPFKGEGSFYNNFPENTTNHFTEIEEGLDYKDFNQTVDWVISNPPFRLETGTKRVNSFFPLVEYYSTRVNKGIAFLGNDYCLSTLSPSRIKKLEQNNLFLNKVVVCNIRKWRGRYFFIVFKKDEPSECFNYLDGCF